MVRMTKTPQINAKLLPLAPTRVPGSCTHALLCLAALLAASHNVHSHTQKMFK